MTTQGIVALIIAVTMLLVLGLCVSHWVLTEVPMTDAGLHGLITVIASLSAVLGGYYALGQRGRK